MQASFAGSGRPRAPGVTALGVLAGAFLQERGTPGFPSWRGLVARLCLQVQAPNSWLPFRPPSAVSGPCALVFPTFWSPGFAEPRPRCGENRSLEEQSSEPAQALNVISSSLNRIGQGSKRIGRASLWEPTFQAWSLLRWLLAPRLHLCSGW